MRWNAGDGWIALKLWPLAGIVVTTEGFKIPMGQLLFARVFARA